MENKAAGIKIHDIHHGLSQISGAIIESEFDTLRTIGAATQIATTIKDHEVIENIKSFYAACGELKIPKYQARESLKRLEMLGFVRLKYTTGQEEIKRIDIVVPDLNSVYTQVGDYFNSANTTVYENGLIETLLKLGDFPHKEKDIFSSLGISDDDYKIIRDVGASASLLDKYTSPNDSESILFSPLYWDDNPQKIFDLLKKHDAQGFLKSLDEIKDYQGLPDSKVSEDILSDAVNLGCLPTLSVKSTNGLRKFLFTPRSGVGKTEKNLLHKARVLISCVRYGENFAGITTIYKPTALIRALANRGFLKAHSESLAQYEAARNLGLVKIIPTINNRYEVHFIDNDENKKVIQMALEMLEIGDTSKYNASREKAKEFLVPGHVLHPTHTRHHIMNDSNIDTSKATVEKVNDLLRGIE